jgi:hypothetical protein
MNQQSDRFASYQHNFRSFLLHILLAPAPLLGLQCAHQHRLPGIARRLPFFVFFETEMRSAAFLKARRRFV